MARMRLWGIADIFRGANTNNEILIYPMLSYNDVKEYKDNLLLDDTIDVKANFSNSNLPDINNKVVVQKGDIIFPMKRRDHTPKFVNWVGNDNLKYIYNNDVEIVRPITHIVDPQFLFWILNTTTIKNSINEQAEKLRPNRLTNAMLGNLEIDVPDPETQEKIIKELEEINIKKLQIEKQFEEYVSK